MYIYKEILLTRSSWNGTTDESSSSASSAKRLGVHVVVDFIWILLQK